MERYNESIEKAVKVLKNGGIILYPTDTVWGIGCDATNSEAVKRIYDLKHRADAKSMLMLVGSEGQLQQYVRDIPDIAWDLLDAAVNPLTIIYDHPVNVSTLLLASDGSAGFRITKEPFSSNLCRRLRRPVVSTSANVSGRPTPLTFAEISKEIREGVDYVVEVRQNEKKGNTPSSIIKLGCDGTVKVIR